MDKGRTRWGNGADGEIGNNDTSNQSSPVVAWLYVDSKNETVSATVDPSFLFSVAGHSSVCNGQSVTNFQTGATSTAVSLGHVTAATVAGGAQDLTVTTNAGNGFTVYLKTSGTTPNSLRDGSGNLIADVAGTNASPGSAPVAGTEGFGYTSSDAATPFTSNTFAKMKTKQFDFDCNWRNVRKVCVHWIRSRGVNDNQSG